MDEVAGLVARQSGVVTRSQLAGCGIGPAGLERLLRHRDLVRVFPGVFVDHTGPLTWEQRAWIGVLLYAPAALVGASALRAAADRPARGDGASTPIEIGIDRGRSRVQRPGYRLRWTTDLQQRVLWNASPPRERIEDAAIDAACRASSDWAAVAVLAGVCQSRGTTAARILEALARRDRVPRRRWLTGVLLDIADGTCSVLEHSYLTRVERPHRLPRPDRQSPGASDRGTIYRDVTYARFGLHVELDGRLFHDSAEARDTDLDRDLDAAVGRGLTVRLGWGQVVHRPCRTAAHLGTLLRAGGWDGAPEACRPTCPVGLVPRP